jgi:hypothetical protein
MCAAVGRSELLPVQWARRYADPTFRSNSTGLMHFDRGMTSGRIVEPLDVVEHMCPGLVPGAIDFARGEFGLQRREEALHSWVVPDVAGTGPCRRRCRCRPSVAGPARWCTGCPDPSGAAMRSACLGARSPSTRRRRQAARLYGPSLQANSGFAEALRRRHKFDPLSDGGRQIF